MVTLQVNLCGRLHTMIYRNQGLIFRLDFGPKFGDHRQCLGNVFHCLWAKSTALLPSFYVTEDAWQAMPLMPHICLV